MIKQNDTNLYRRQLGYIESVMTASQDLLNGTAQICVGIEVKLKKSLNHENIIDVCRSLHKRFEVLRYSIHEDQTGYCFYEDVEFKNEKIVFEKNPNMSLEAYLFSHLDNNLNRKTSLWKVYVNNRVEAETAQILLSINHAAVDSFGVNEILRTLLLQLDCILNTEETHVLPDERMVKEIDKYLKKKSTSQAVQGQKYTRIKESRLCDIAQRSTGVLSAKLNCKHSDMLREIARYNGVTVNSLLAVVFAQSSVVLGLADTKLQIKSAVSLREITNETSKLGCFIDVAKVDITLNLNDVFANAKEYEKRLTGEIFARCLYKNDVAHSDIKKAIASVESQPDFDAGVCMTNIGAFDVPLEYKNFTLVDYLPLAKRVSKSHACVLHVHEFKNEYHFNLVHPAPSFSGSLASQLMDLFYRHLENFVLENIIESETKCIEM